MSLNQWVVKMLVAATVSTPQPLLVSKPQPIKVSNPQPLPVSKPQRSTASTSHSLTAPQPALTTLNVTLNTDDDPGGIGEVGDLRFALNQMNQGLNTTPDDYAIVFAFPMTIQLNGILPIINNSANPVNITIGNPGSTPTVTIDGNNGAYPGFFIPIGNVTIQNMIFQNLTAKGGDGGNGTSGGGGGMGAGGAIYAPQSFLNGSNPSITLINVLINDCSAVGGNGGSYFGVSATGNEGGAGGGGFSGNGGSITTSGSTGGGGGGGFGGNGGDVTLSTDDLLGGGGGGGGGLGSRATIGTPTNLGHGGADQGSGLDGNGFGLTITAGSGGGGNSGGNNAGGGGGGDAIAGFTGSGGGGGGSAGSNGTQPQGSTAPGTNAVSPAGGTIVPSGGNGGDGGGGGGGGVVAIGPTNGIDGQAAGGGYGGGGGGGAGTGSFDVAYTVQGGTGGLGGGGGGGGVNQSGTTSAEGGNSFGGGGGAGGGPSNGPTALGGADVGSLGGGSGGSGANTVGAGFGGGGGGGGSGLGGAIFVDSGLNFTIQASPGVPTTFNTSNNTTQAGTHGTGGPGGSDGADGSALGNSIFLRAGSSLTLMAQDANDLLTLGEQVAFTDDTTFGGGGTSVFVRGNGTVVYNGTTDFQGFIGVYNANFKVNGQIDASSIFVCRNVGFSLQRGVLSGTGTMTGNVFVNSGAISPDAGSTLTVGTLALNSPNTPNNTIGSLVHIGINSSGTSLVAVTGAASLAGTLQIDLDANAQPGSYTILTSSGITGTFDLVAFTGPTPNYSLRYLPAGAPTYVQFDLLAPSPSPTPGRLINISSRARIGTGDQVGINGFIVRGSAPKKIFARAVGPSLAVNNQPIPGRLLDPILELHGRNGSLIFSNDNWITSPQKAQIQASGLAPNDSREPAIIATLPQGSYTTVIRGKNNTTGIALGEVYVLPPDNSSELVNLSGRALTLTGDNVLISGLIIGGQTTKLIVVRAIGPTLHGSVTGELQDPTLSLYNGNGTVLRTNDNWRNAPNHAQIQAVGLAPTDDRESAIMLNLVPGRYTAIVRGVNGTTGLALVEVYALP